MSKGVPKGAPVRQQNLKGWAASYPQVNRTFPNAGSLNRRITIQERNDPNSPGDGGGGTDLSWSLFGTYWANIRPMTAREIFLNGQVEGQGYYIITMRYVLGITPMMQVVYKNRTMNIRSVTDPEEAHESIELLVQELQEIGVTQ